MKILLIAITFLSITIPSFGYEWYMENHPHFMTSSNINQLLNDPSSIKIVKFFTPWCRYCRYMKKNIDDFHEKVKRHGRNDIKFFQVNCQQQVKICQQYSISSYPYINIFGKNGKIVSNLPGYYPQDDTHQILNDIIKQIDQLDNHQTTNLEESVYQAQQLNIVQQQQQIQPKKTQQAQKKLFHQPEDSKQNLQKNHKNEQNVKVFHQQLKQVNKKTESQKDAKPKNQQYSFEIKKSNEQTKQKTNTAEKPHLNLHNETFTEKMYKQIFRIMLYLLIGLLGGYYFKDIFAKNKQNQLSNPQEINQYNSQKLPEDEPLIKQ